MKQFIIDYITTIIETARYYYFATFGVLLMIKCERSPELFNSVALGNLVALLIVSFLIALKAASDRIKKGNKKMNKSLLSEDDFILSFKHAIFHCDKQIDSEIYERLNNLHDKIKYIPFISIKTIDFYIKYDDTLLFNSFKLNFKDNIYEKWIYKNNNFILDKRNYDSRRYDYDAKHYESDFFVKCFTNIINDDDVNLKLNIDKLLSDCL